MKVLDLTLPSPEENLACDEVLLDACDGGQVQEVLRFWEPRQHFVVVGYANRVGQEVNVQACQESGIPILRRCSGGGTVVQGPGCLNYSLILRIDSHPSLKTVTGTNRFVMERNRAALESVLADRRGRGEPGSQNPESRILHPESCISIQGHTDLAIDGRKFSGNAQRRRRNALLFHGSLLLDFDLSLVSKLLPMPSKEPNYRRNRSHADFVTNLEMATSEVRAALSQVWKAVTPFEDTPIEQVRQLARTRYSKASWNQRL